MVMLCTAALVDGCMSQPDLLIYLPIYLQNFLDQTATSKVLEHLRDQLMQRNCICGIAQGTSTAMHMGHFTWMTPDIPTKFTIFALPQKKADTLDVMGLMVKAVEGKGLDVSNTKSLAKLHLQ
eukprot:8752810-Ditylum_brightwellii.AAC.1